MNRLKRFLLSIKFLRCILVPSSKFLRSFRLYKRIKPILNSCKNENNKIFYIGIPVHSNLGDLAQGVCIRRWIKENYPDCLVVEIETNMLVNTYFSALGMLKKAYKNGDIIIFQSGYTTTDLGGYADEMHRAVMKVLPDANMLMMPQTIFFEKEENKKRTSVCYNKMKNMLFLARDKVSYSYAQEMFPDINIDLFPDIVTTMIGTKKFNYTRDGILFCTRDDGEKFYSDTEISGLMEKCKAFAPVDQTDTTKNENVKDIVKNAEDVINHEIDTYAHYKLIITDRYHGTILSLAAGTPVIIIKTTDHKVVTGADWFKGVYDDYVFVVSNLDEACELAKELVNKEYKNKLEPHFKSEYYDKLKTIYNGRIQVEQ